MRIFLVLYFAFTTTLKVDLVFLILSNEASIDFVSPIVIIFLLAVLFSVDKLNEET